MQTKTRHFTFTLIGDSMSGKSTMLGHLLHQLKAFHPSVFRRVNNIIRDGYIEETYKYSAAVDKHKEEKCSQMTRYLNYHAFESHNYICSVINAPGHPNYIKNTITALFESDFAILVVSAAKDGLKSSTLKGQFRQHLLAAYALGIRHLIVAVNKMDTTPDQPWSHKRYVKIICTIKRLLQKIGFKLEHVTCVPVSAWTGDNLTEKSALMHWHQGPTLKSAIDLWPPLTRRKTGPLRFSVSGRDKIGGVGTVILGKVLSGQLRPGMRLQFNPSGLLTTVKSIEMNYKDLARADVGDCIGFIAERIRKYQIRSGLVASSVSDSPASNVESFVAKIVVLDYKGRIKPGFNAALFCHTMRIGFRFDSFLETIERKSGRVIDSSPEFITEGNCANVVIVPTRPVCVEVIDEFPELGSLIIRAQQKIIAVGTIKSVSRVKVANSGSE